MSDKPKHGDLRIWWIPQIPGTPFHVQVASPREGKKLLDVLADYDLFQLKNNIKGDYSNVGGLEVFERPGEWSEWENEDGENVDDVDFDLAEHMQGDDE